MENIINNNFRLKSEPNSSGKRVIHFDENNIYFSDNGRVSKSVFFEKFEKVLNNQPSMNQQQIFENNVNVDDTLLDSTPAIMNVLDMYKKGKSDYVPLEEQKSSLVSGGDISQLNPETIKILEQNQKNLNKPVVNNQQNDEWYIKNFGKPDNGGEIKTYNNDELKEKLEKANYSNQHKTVLETNTSSINISPVQELLNKMRYSKSVSLKITFNEMIPKLEDIKSMQKIFDELPIVETIAEKIANKYFQDKDLFVNMIIGELEKLMKKPTRKPIKKNINKNVSK